MRQALTRVVAQFAIASLLFVVTQPSTMTAIQLPRGLANGCQQPNETHWVAQWTSVASTFSHGPATGYPYRNGYYGWVGIDGEVDFPNYVPYLGSGGGLCSHSSGQLGFYLGDGSWVQTGWYSGCFILVDPPVCRYITLGGYVEKRNVGTNTYNVFDVSPNSPVSPGSAIIFMIEWGGGCWNTYWMYNVSTGGLCSPIPSSGEAWAGAEVHTHNQNTYVEMPLQYFGNSNPYTNNGLRIKGANGFVPWTTSLSSYYTSMYDEANGAQGCFTINPSTGQYVWHCTVYYYYDTAYPNYRFGANGE